MNKEKIKMSMKRLLLMVAYSLFAAFSSFGLESDSQSKELRIATDSIINCYNLIDTSYSNPENIQPYCMYVHKQESMFSGASCQGFFISKNLFLFYKILEIYNPEFKWKEIYLFDSAKNVYLWDVYGYFCDNGQVRNKPKEFTLENNNMIKQLYLSYGEWTRMLKKKGLKYLRMNSIDPLFKTTITVERSSSLFSGVQVVPWEI